MRCDHAENSFGGLVVINPLEHPDWDALLATHPESGFFHGGAWARVLHRTYGHRPVYFCRIANGRLVELLAVMEVVSPWTGRRGVSLPFTDVCAVLRDTGQAGSRLHEAAVEFGVREGWKYLECRGGVPDWPGASPSVAFYGHNVELSGPPEQLFESFQGAVRRGVRKALDAGVKVEFSRHPESMQTFYQLHCLTRQRHGVPPQPRRFFESIASEVLAEGHGFVTTARFGAKPLAAAVYFHRHRRAIYKFGASDGTFQHMRPNNLVMWETIRRCAQEGFEGLHLGRTSVVNTGLRRFKLGFGAREERMEYCRYDLAGQTFVPITDRAEGWFNGLFRSLPLPWLRLAGRILYPHLS
ncbi:MAG: GNAT family N-acetyltransferase [Verrucomicrobia bacterium]|nr:GNAT family N-acetyltransferase [Verrucomicrobiota bacterium]